MKPGTKNFYLQAVQRAADHVAGTLDSAPDFELLAHHAAMSPFHFHRVFRGMLGETPLELHRRLRLERAAWSLLNDGAPVTTIAFDAGYETHEAFTRTFRTRYGCSPSEFRRRSVAAAAACERPLQTGLATRSGIHFVPDGRDNIDFTFLEGDHDMDVAITDMPAMRAAAVRHIGAYNRISKAFAQLGEIAGAAGLFRPDALMLGLYHDDPETTPEDELRSDAALTISPATKVPEGLTEVTIPAGRYARTTHIGPYEKLPDVWARFMGDWLPGSGERFGNGVSYELYRNDPTDTAPEDLITELYIPLA